MIQLKVYDSPAKVEQTFLDLYETEPIKLTLSIEDITNADATSTFSKTFKVPGTRKNWEFFKNAFDVDGTMFDVTVKKPAEILVDGAEFKQGHIRLQKIYLNTLEDKIDYELVFLGETRNFSSLIGDRSLCELEMPDVVGGASGALTYNDVVESWKAYPADRGYDTNPASGTYKAEITFAPSLTNGLHDGNIIYPLIDHGNTYDSAGNVDQTRISVDGSYNFTQQSSPLFINRLKPMIRAKRIWDQIFSDAGYTYESQFIDSALFQQIYISAFGNLPNVNWDNGASSTNSENIAHGENPSGAINSIVYTTNIIDAGGNFTPTTFGGGAYTAYQIPLGGEYCMEASIYWLGTFESSDYISTPVGAKLVIWNNTQSVALAETSYQPSGSTIIVSGTFNTATTPNFAIGDEIILRVVEQSLVTDYFVDDVSFSVTCAPGIFNPITAFDCTYKQIDFIKDILTSFRLVLAPDPNNPLNFIVEPWQEYINSGDVLDWSHKLVENRDVQVEPLFYDQSAEIEFAMQPGGDYVNIYHQQATDHVYGWLQFQSNNDLLIGKRDVKLIGMAPTPIAVIEGGDTDYILPQIHTHSATDTGTQHLAIKARTRMLFYNGLQYINTIAHRWYLDGWTMSATDHFHYYPLVSPYQEWPITPTSLNLNFANDIQYWGAVPGYNDNGYTLYTEYWSRYIESLYNKYSRRVTANFVLNNIDLNNFSFDDTIFVNGTYYRPEKIIDVQIGQYSEATVQLITANDYRAKSIYDETLTNFSVVGYPGNCHNEAGYIDVTTDGTPGFTWQLSNGASGSALTSAPPGAAPYTFSIPNVVAGTYTVTVTDSLGRTNSAPVTITAPVFANVQAAFTITDATSCRGACNGQISVSPSGGVAPYTIEWSDDPFNTNFTRTGLCPQDYSFRVLDTNGCSSPYYRATVNCNTGGGDIYELRQLNLACQITSNSVLVSSIGALNPGDVYGLQERAGCWVVTGISIETVPTDYLDIAYLDCESCQGGTPPVTENWEDVADQWESDTDNWENA